LQEIAAMDENKKDIRAFISNLWFFLFYFLILVMIASFGIIAEA
jgi:hypothetical protein